MNSSFIEKCINGDASLDEIDNYIDEWHDSDSDMSLELHEFLGMTWEEYSLWVVKPRFLAWIINARRKGVISSEEKFKQESQPLAARSYSTKESLQSINWLKSIGKI
ncbi:MAG: hypothetical protein DCE90_11395 [Pseudanabaena sp.]|nr:MAG: hypothetical protein DCE90_11395 [Pseudanabaena sp.]